MYPLQWMSFTFNVFFLKDTHLLSSVCFVSLEPVRTACTSLWPRLRVRRAWASPWIRVAACSPASPSWSTTTAHTGCRSPEQSTWPCSILFPGHAEHKLNEQTHWDINTHAHRGVLHINAQMHTERHTHIQTHINLLTLMRTHVLKNMLLWICLVCCLRIYVCISFSSYVKINCPFHVSAD